MSRGPATGKLSRNWIISLCSVLGVAAAVLLVVLTRGSATQPQPDPAVGYFDADRTGTPDRSIPSAPSNTAPVSVAPALPPLVVTSFSAVKSRQAAVPDGPPTGASTRQPSTKPGGTVPPPPNATAYNTIRGESFSEQSGVQKEPDASGSGVHIGFISTGDWVRYDDVGFTDVPANALLISASNAARENRTGQVELRLDSRANAPVGSLTIVNNGNWFAFTTYTMKITPTTGVHTIYLTFKSNQTEEFANVDWLRFQH